MTRVIPLLRWCLAAVLLLTVAVPTAHAAAAGAKPNIVFVLADDLGWSDVGGNDSQFCETPNIDRLAREGLRFTQGYAPAPICSASRAALLTGRSPARLHFEFVTKPEGSKPAQDREVVPPAYPLNLPLSEVTTGEALKPAGYATGFIGKWHLNEHHQRYLGYSPTHGPQQQGFDVVAEDRGSHPYNYQERTFGEAAKGEFPADQLTQNAIQFMRAHRDQPFLLHVSHYYVHDPVHTRCRWLFDKYDAKAKRLGVKHSPAYGAMVETLDHYVGELLRGIDELGLRERTLVVFTSDNGGHPAYTSNAPLRGSKWNLYEGGVRVPWIVRWPGVVKPGGRCDVPVIGMDLFPTFCEVADAKPPSDRVYDGRSLVPLFHDPQGGGWPSRDLVWHFPYYHPEKGYTKALGRIGAGDFAVSKTRPQSTILRGHLKLIHFYDTGTVELHDLGQDLGEARDLHSTLPDKTGEMRHALEWTLRSLDARLPAPGHKK